MSALVPLSALALSEEALKSLQELISVLVQVRQGVCGLNLSLFRSYYPLGLLKYNILRHLHAASGWMK